MRLSKLAGWSVAGLSAAFAIGLAVSAAQAQSSRRVVRAEGPNTERITVVDENGRVRTRITVRPRSFLDPGKETLAFDQHYHDYAMEPGQSRSVPSPTYNGDYRFSYDRMPLNGPWDVPGWTR
jgi:hypothetical protein